MQTEIDNLRLEHKDFFKRIGLVYQLHPIGVAMKERRDYLDIAEIFISNRNELSRYVAGHPITDYIEPYFTALSVKILGELGFGFVIKPDYNPNLGLSDREIFALKRDKYERLTASGLIHLAIYNQKRLREETLGAVFNNKENHLKEAEKAFKDGLSKKFNERGKLLLSVLQNGRYQ